VRKLKAAIQAEQIKRRNERRKSESYHPYCIWVGHDDLRSYQEIAATVPPEYRTNFEIIGWSNTFVEYAFSKEDTFKPPHQVREYNATEAEIVQRREIDRAAKLAEKLRMEQTAAPSGRPRGFVGPVDYPKRTVH
jgi:hypothetical protein